MAKPKLSDFTQHCGDCLYCHAMPQDKKAVGCFVNPPEFSGWDGEDAMYLPRVITSVDRPHCRHFVSRATN